MIQTATEKQTAFIIKLLDERTGYSPGFRERLEAGIATGDVDKAKASEVIGWLLEKPRAVAEVKAVSDATVPAGFYAVESMTGNNDLDFVRVDRPTEGKWAGYTFVKRIVGGHADTPVRGAAKHATLKAIEDAGIAASAQKYGQEIGRCCHCHRLLTDEASRKFGIGPVCRGDLSHPLVAAIMGATASV